MLLWWNKVDLHHTLIVCGCSPLTLSFNLFIKASVLPAKAESTKGEVSPEQAGKKALHPALTENVLFLFYECISDRCNIPAVETHDLSVSYWTDDAVLQSTNDWTTMDWDSWHKRLLAILDKESMCNSGVDITAIAPNGGTAELAVAEGILAVA